GRVLDGIADEVDEDLSYAVGIASGFRQVTRDLGVDRATLLVGDGPECVDRARDPFAHVEWLHLEDDATALDTGYVEHVVDELDEPVGVLLHDGEELLLYLVDLAGFSVEDQVDVALDRGERGAELV